jgi:hypothetical protein
MMNILPNSDNRTKGIKKIVAIRNEIVHLAKVVAVILTICAYILAGMYLRSIKVEVQTHELVRVINLK